MQIINLIAEILLVAQDDDIVAVPRNESILVILMAFSLAFGASYLLRRTGEAMKAGRRERAKDKIKLEGELGKLKWYYTGTGQVAVFVAVFLVIVTLYIALRLTPGT